MDSVLIKVYVTVDSIDDAEDIADDIHEILSDSGIINGAEVVNEGDL